MNNDSKNTNPKAPETATITSKELLNMVPALTREYENANQLRNTWQGAVYGPTMARII